MKDRYLSKSKFQLAMECPTKLYYCDKPEYSNLKTNDSFLQALAENGFQVAGLARAYYPKGISISTLDAKQAVMETNELLKRDEVTIFEAAVVYKDFFVRIDILIKNANHLTLIEIKSKSIGQEDKIPFFTSRGVKTISSEWRPYIFDLAFQKLVLSKCFANICISSSLMVVDKNSICPSDGLNQKFRLTKDENGQTRIIKRTLVSQDLSVKLLREINIDEEIEFIFNEMKFNKYMNFSQYVDFLNEKYKNDEKIAPILGSQCRRCEFKLDKKVFDSKIQNGFVECWSESYPMGEDEPTVLDIWNYRDVGNLLQRDIYKIKQLNKEDINPQPDKKPGMSSSQRQWMQVEKIINSDDTMFLDENNLIEEMKNWKYPLNFIDFETIMPAIPFNKDEKPFLGIAFQFSHHLLYEDGTVEHVAQYINTEVGKNPNLDFIRKLKLSLENNSGSIFRYSTHENTFLNIIYTQICSMKTSFSDKEDLLFFIEQIASPTEKNEGAWHAGSRNMVDLCELVKRYYYDPLTNGTNSIKQVFPAILNRSLFLQNKYSKPIYGAQSGIKSLNFENWQWIEKKENKIKNPYELLPPLFMDMNISEEQVDFLFLDEKINEGGMASIAYTRMQFSEMSDIERSELTKALLKYCELDTLAMVMLVEAWKDMVKLT